MAAADSRFGCIEFESYQEARNLNNKQAFAYRARVLLWMVNVMENWPAERFTIEGWKDSGEELPRAW